MEIVQSILDQPEISCALPNLHPIFSHILVPDSGDAYFYFIGVFCSKSIETPPCWKHQDQFSAVLRRQLNNELGSVVEQESVKYSIVWQIHAEFIVFLTHMFWQDERIKHAETKQKLMEAEDKLEYANGEIEILQKQIQREKKQFDQAWVMFKRLRLLQVTLKVDYPQYAALSELRIVPSVKNESRDTEIVDSPTLSHLFQVSDFKTEGFDGKQQECRARK